MKDQNSLWRRWSACVQSAPIIAVLVTFGDPVLGQELETSDYEIFAIQYATFSAMPTSTFIRTADPDETMDAAAIIWLIRDAERVILFDTGFHRRTYLDAYPVTDFMRPDEAVQLAGVAPDEVTDIIVSHAHWDHMGGIDLFLSATIWIQEEEYRYYTADAWQPDGESGPIDADDIVHLVHRNTLGQVRLIQGDSVEFLPGITAYTGARHTYASQYIQVGGYVLASDNCYLYRNMEEHEPIGITFSEADRDLNLAAIERMLDLAGSADRVIPGHDPLQFEKFTSEGRVARIR